MAEDRRKNVEKAEEEFHRFMLELLSAEVHESPVEEQRVFSFDALKRILGQFCDLIADHLHCDSCTIQLQLYDYSQVDQHTLLSWMKEHFTARGLNAADIDTWLRESESEVDSEDYSFFTHRKHHLISHLTFPYWHYGKGLSVLVATRQSDPWTPVLLKKKERLKYRALESGVTLDVYQENTARVRDRLSMRETRNLRKLGRADIVVWNNLDWHNIFKTYYGVPIRIHSAGEVVGLLKVENKVTRDSERLEELLKTKVSRFPGGPDDGGKSLLSILAEKARSIDEIDELTSSLLSLIYLKEDLANSNDKVLSDCLLLPYPQAIAEAAACFKLGLIDLLNASSEEVKLNPDDMRMEDVFALVDRLYPDSQGRLTQIEKTRNEQWRNVLYEKRNALHQLVQVLLFSTSKRGEVPTGTDRSELSSSNPEKHRSAVKKQVKEMCDRCKKLSEKDYSSLLLPEGEGAPVQLFFTSIEDERALWWTLWRHREKRDDEVFIERLYEVVSEFYHTVAGVLRRRIEYEVERHQIGRLRASDGCLATLADALHDEQDEKYEFMFPSSEPDEGRSKAVTPWYELNPVAPDFHFAITVRVEVKPESRGEGADAEIKQRYVSLYACVPPSASALAHLKDNTLAVAQMYAGQLAFLGKDAPHDLSGLTQRRRAYLKDWEAKGWEHECGGELHHFFGVSDCTKRAPLRITDLLHDRLAARIQAFSMACPVPEFGLEDTHKLTWAAYEIAKLIERQIAYRGNRSGDPMPLTTLEFCGLPISDMSFVDNLRKRRDNLEEVGNNIDVHLEDMIAHMGMARDITYTARKKDYLSYFQRARERYEGYLRGNIAIWVYLLSLYEPTIFHPEARREISGNLEKFRGLVDDMCGIKDRNKSAVSLHCDEMRLVYGDLKFDSPPFLDAESIEDNDSKPKGDADKMQLEHLVLALKLVTENLHREGLIDTPIDLVLLTKNIEQRDHLHEYLQDHAAALTRLLLRDYSCFTRDALSLTLQLVNRILYGTSFRTFYRECHDLRAKLCSPQSEIREDIEGRALVRAFGLDGLDTDEEASWRTIYNFTATHRTEDVLITKPGEEHDPLEYLRLTPKGIYKRIRTLQTVLKRQQPPAILDWELGRFDFYGARLNCLFKNQVFALYENIWNKGDPFFPCALSETQLDVFACLPHDETCEPSKHRKRWLCLRTSAKSGGYTSVHVAALVDPASAHDGYWEDDRRYNLRKVQHVLGNIFLDFEGRTAEQYRNHSWHRHLISKQYTRWYENYVRLMTGERRDKGHVKWFGSFLFEGIFDLAMILIYTLIDAERFRDNHLIGKSRFGLHSETLAIIQDSLLGRRDPNIREDFIRVLLGLYYVCHYGIEYSKDVTLAMCDSDRLTKQHFRCDGREVVSATDSPQGSSEELYRTEFRERDFAYLKEYYRGITPSHLGADQETTCKCAARDAAADTRQATPQETRGGETTREDQTLPRENLTDATAEDATWTRCANAGNSCNLYDHAIQLLEELIKQIESVLGASGFKASEDIHILRQVRDNLANELRFFLSVRTGKIEYDAPLFFLDASSPTSRDYQAFMDLKFIVLKIHAMGSSLSRNATTEELWFLLYRALRHIRREQRSYLLAEQGRTEGGTTEVGRTEKDRTKKGKPQEDATKEDKARRGAGLWRRDKTEILARIKNYALLFSPEKHIGVNADNTDLFRGWNAHDLYYYLRSLIPMEIQIRTKLIDTLAEQYHDPVYKRTPPFGTELPRANMIDVGEDVDKADRELEIDYEDYALGFQLDQEAQEDEDDC